MKITQDIYQHGDAVMLAGAMKALEAYVQAAYSERKTPATG